MNKGIAIIISCEHASNATGEFAYLFKENEGVLETHLGYDLGAVEMAKEMSKRLEAPMSSGTKSRLIIELNRTLGHPGLFSTYSTELSEAEKNSLIKNYYQPYVDKLKKLISDNIKSHGHVLHLSIHSFTPIFNGQVRTADIGLLFDPERKHEKQFCSTWLRSLHEKKPDFTSLPNYPYLGSDDGLTTYFRGKFSDNEYMGIEVEVSQLHGADHKMVTELLLESLQQTLEQHDLLR